MTLLSGYVPIPFELIKRRGRVVDIDFWFLLLDSSGALFSLMSLGMFGGGILKCTNADLEFAVAQNTFDIEFGTLYSIWSVLKRL